MNADRRRPTSYRTRCVVIPGNTPADAITAASAITQAIADHGPITFAEFMQAALYGPGGYYSSCSPISASGDYFTSPVAHPLFGALIAVQLREMWQELGSPELFSVVESAAGNGGLAADITKFAVELDPVFAESMRYAAFDAVPPERQHYPVLPLNELPQQITGCVLSNELLDAMPVHRFEVREGDVLEIFVGLEEGRLVEQLLAPSTPLIGHRIQPFLEQLPDGYRGEVNAELGLWAERQAKILERGWVLTIDYGFERSALYRPDRIMGSLRCYYQHVLGQDPLQHVGKQDITAHVDFTAVDEAMAAAGFTSAGTTIQADFLQRLGLDAAFEQLHALRIPRPVLRANEQGILSLVDPAGMGSFVVAVHSRNVPARRLIGFDSNSPPNTELPGFPLLSSERHINLVGPSQQASGYFEMQALDELFSDEP